MVLVMESDGSLTPSRSQSSFARNYNDGIGQGSAADELAIFGEREAEPEDIQLAALARPAPLPRADVLTAIEARRHSSRAYGP
ncbi:Soluble lytic murein transglycosylase (plasmid) [Phaeobacter inhibens]|uniref:Soluble lytic murein transglycosylase n=1 Tax=Phaeobacter inhibens TaxID=221822 RepID=A0ABN5GU47_9RHOB|nr:Soluble lytic murein transglycosylase [Phaeobacter inhibens]AUQ96915.1 Soluble lytic murein transglycosylase [Phaeobacter inhibens]AUR22116.1 Soluble lytic murein transglycosylase [Phaeobacter inhibens]